MEPFHASSDSAASNQSYGASDNNSNREMIFGQPRDAFTLEKVKKILTMFKKQGAIRRNSKLETLLPKLLDLESKLSYEEHITVVNLLSRDGALTCASLAEGAKFFDEAGEEVFHGENKTCQICFADLPAGMFRKGYFGYQFGELTRECRAYSFHNACTNCMNENMKVSCQSNHWHDLRCPLCLEKLEQHIVKKYLSGDTLIRYTKYMETYEIREQEGFCWCLSPTCNSGQIHKPGNGSPKMTCCKCGFETCFTHQRPWHQGRTCEEVGDLDSKAEKESEAWIKSQTKSCPTCDAATTKSEGCNMVICSCGEAWDWKTKNLIDMD